MRRLLVILINDGISIGSAYSVLSRVALLFGTIFKVAKPGLARLYQKTFQKHKVFSLKAKMFQVSCLRCITS